MALSSLKSDYLIKIVLIGDASVGKTNILSRLTKNKYDESSKPTIGVDFGTKIFKFDNDTVRVQIWDTAGQERYHAISTAYYRGSLGSVLVYDISNPRSLDNIRTIWLKNLNLSVEKSIPKMLLGNKSDLSNNRMISYDSGKSLSLADNMTFFETSALTGENIEKAFEEFISKIYETEKRKITTNQRSGFKGLEYKGKEITGKQKKSNCC